MAEWYIDHGCTLYPSAYMSAPASAASLPQEGDGRASGTGTAPAVASASWDLTSASASSGTMSVMGATITGLSASGAALATAIASAINSSTAAVTASTGGIASPYLRGLCWAAASGATLTVYTRIASANLNYHATNAPNCQMVAGTGWTSPPATAQFSGGVSGPWSSFFNAAALTSTISSSVGGAGTYGGVVATMMGSPAAGDVIHVRTGRAGSDIVLNVGSTLCTVNMRAVGTINSYLEIRFDNGAVWSDGASNGVFTVDKSLTGGHTYLFPSGYTHVRGQMKTGTSAVSGGVVNFKVQSTFAETSGFQLVFYFTGNMVAGRHLIAEGIEFYDSNTGSIWAMRVFQRDEHTDLAHPARFVNCKFGHCVRSNAALFTVNNAAFTFGVEAVDCLFALGSISAYTNILYAAGNIGTNNASQMIRLTRPKFTGGGGGHHSLLPFASGVQYTGTLYIEDPVDMGQFVPSDSAASCCGRGSGIFGNTATHVQREFGLGQFITSTTSTRDFLIDTPTRLLEWRNAGFPTTGISLLPDGTPFSVRFSLPYSGFSSVAVSRGCPSPGLRQVVTNTLGDQASLTITERFLVDSNYGGSSYTPADNDWWIEGKYVATDGSVKTFTTRGTGTALSADTTTWSSLTFAPFGGGVRNYSRWKIEKTITNVKAGSDISLTLMCAKQPSTMSEWCFIDPQFGLST